MIWSLGDKIAISQNRFTLCVCNVLANVARHVYGKVGVGCVHQISIITSRHHRQKYYVNTCEKKCILCHETNN